MRVRGGISVKLAALCAVAMTWLAVPGTASAVPPGSDLFETDPQSTEFRFSGLGEIPAGFFNPGSDPFQGQVHFGGVPLQTFGTHGVGDADTVVMRPIASNPPPTIPIEIVALNLVSVEPITVTYNGGQNPEPWNVAVGLAPTQNQGQMTINQGTGGGTFNSQLPVSPRFTFTRLTDGAQRTVDPGSHNLQAGNVPWRAGCVLPALAVAGLNDQFCPGQTPEGQKQLTVEQSLLANHGVYPAQPALEHFKCYKLKKKRFQKRQVTLNDQFGGREAKVKKRAELCNPVQKNQEPFLNQDAHLQCYQAKGPQLGTQVAVQNQFGSQRLLVQQARTLCVPSEKRKPKKQFRPIQVPIDHFQCYDVQPQTPLQRFGTLPPVTLNDQFGREQNVTVGDPKRLCAPVQKNQEPLQHPVKHLVCYAIKDKQVHKTVQLRNQFEQRTVQTKKPVLLCVPSNKLRL